MSHVDDGALHAYLDGALDEYPAAEARRIREHIETCAVCAEALSAERLVRDEAHTILNLATPAVDVPTFEELRAYVVRTSRTEGKTTSKRLYRMSWAASVVLALGTGYMLRGGDAVPIAPLEQLQEAPAETGGSTDGRADDVANAAVSAEVDAVAPPAAEEGNRLEAPPATASEVAAPALGATSNASARADVAQAPSAPAAGQGGQVAPSAPVIGRDVPEVRGFSDAVTQGAGVAGQAAAGPPPAPAPQASGARVAERIDSVARANQPERRVAAQQDVVISSGIAADAASSPAARQRAENERSPADEESGSLVVPGLYVFDVLPVGQGTTFAGMRALQRLESGDTLELVHLPEAIDPTFLPPLRAGMSELVRRRGDGWLVMRAPVTERYLEELLQRLEGAR
jgi:hypothetical protein